MRKIVSLAVDPSVWMSIRNASSRFIREKPSCWRMRGVGTGLGRLMKEGLDHPTEHRFWSALVALKQEDPSLCALDVLIRGSCEGALNEESMCIFIQENFTSISSLLRIPKTANSLSALMYQFAQSEDAGNKLPLAIMVSRFFELLPSEEKQWLRKRDIDRCIQAESLCYQLTPKPSAPERLRRIVFAEIEDYPNRESQTVRAFEVMAQAAFPVPLMGEMMSRFSFTNEALLTLGATLLSRPLDLFVFLDLIRSQVPIEPGVPACLDPLLGKLLASLDSDVPLEKVIAYNWPEGISLSDTLEMMTCSLFSSSIATATVAHYFNTSLPTQEQVTEFFSSALKTVSLATLLEKTIGSELGLTLRIHLFSDSVLRSAYLHYLESSELYGLFDEAKFFSKEGEYILSLLKKGVAQPEHHAAIEKLTTLISPFAIRVVGQLGDLMQEYNRFKTQVSVEAKQMRPTTVLVPEIPILTFGFGPALIFKVSPSFLVFMKKNAVTSQLENNKIIDPQKLKNRVRNLSKQEVYTNPAYLVRKLIEMNLRRERKWPDVPTKTLLGVLMEPELAENRFSVSTLQKLFKNPEFFSKRVAHLKARHPQFHAFTTQMLFNFFYPTFEKLLTLTNADFNDYFKRAFGPSPQMKYLGSHFLSNNEALLLSKPGDVIGFASVNLKIRELTQLISIPNRPEHLYSYDRTTGKLWEMSEDLIKKLNEISIIPDPVTQKKAAEALVDAYPYKKEILTKLFEVNLPKLTWDLAFQSPTPGSSSL